MWLHYDNRNKGFKVLDERTICLGRFLVNTGKNEVFNPAIGQPSSRSIAYQSNQRVRNFFPDFDESLQWCRSQRFGVKVVRTMERLPERIPDPWGYDYYETLHECVVSLQFKNVVHATYWKLRWWQ